MGPVECEAPEMKAYMKTEIEKGELGIPDGAITTSLKILSSFMNICVCVTKQRCGQKIRNSGDK